MKHTKGPWALQGLKVLAKVGDTPFEHIATVITLPCIGGSDDVAAQKACDMEQANARLIAAAPEMYQFLVRLGRRDPFLAGELQDLIAKAEGR